MFWVWELPSRWEEVRQFWLFCGRDHGVRPAACRGSRACLAGLLRSTRDCKVVCKYHEPRAVVDLFEVTCSLYFWGALDLSLRFETTLCDLLDNILLQRV